MQKRTETPAIVAETDETRQQPKIIHAYRLEGGGVVFTATPIEDDPEAENIIDAKEPEADTRSKQQKAPLYLLHVLFLFIVFVGLDNVDAVLAQFAPVVTVTIIPQVQTVSTTATISVGESGADIYGRLLSPLTMSQSQTTQATGRGHQDATRASGSLTFYNASFSPQTIPAGSIFLGGDGIQIATSATITVPANNPPQDGLANVAAYAVHVGQQGNIQTLDINGMASSSLFVKNRTAFRGGQNARDFTVVSKADIQGVVTTLTPRLVESERAALTSQLTTSETLLTPSCNSKISPDHAPGDEAANVTVTLSETCTALAYNAQELQTKSTQLFIVQQAASLTHFQQVGDIHMSIISQTIHGNRATLNVQLVSTWVYQLNEQKLTQRIIGKPRLDALHLLAVLPGVGQVSIVGVKDNEQLPTDLTHIHLLIIVEG